MGLKDRNELRLSTDGMENTVGLHTACLVGGVSFEYIEIHDCISMIKQ